MARDKSGKSLEQIVGRIQQMMDPCCSITYREKIKNRLGIEREFDVVIRGHFAGHEILGVIECKDWSHKIGTPEIDAFVTKSSDINAGLRIIVSPKGFTEPALLQSKDAGVGVYSLLPNDPAEVGFSIGIAWYGTMYHWGDVGISLNFHDGSPIPGSYMSEEVHFEGKPIVNTVLKYLCDNYRYITTSDPIGIAAEFDSPVQVSIADRRYWLSKIEVNAQRHAQKKRKFFQMTGDAFIDCLRKRILVPPQGLIQVHEFAPDLLNWDDFEGDLPLPGPYQLLVTRYYDCIDSENAIVADVPQMRLSGHPRPPKVRTEI